MILRKNPVDAETRQQALNNISPEDLAKLRESQTKTAGAYPVDNEWMLLAEFAKAFGWLAYLDARSNAITIAEMMTLLEANRKLEYFDMFRNSQAVFIGAGSAQSTKPSKTFQSLTKNMLNEARVK